MIQATSITRTWSSYREAPRNKKKAPNHRGQDEEPQGGYPHQISKPTKPAFSSSNLPAKYPKSFRTAATAAKDP